MTSASITLLLFISQQVFANNEWFADRVRIMPSGEICVFEKNEKKPVAENIVCSQDYATPEDRENHRDINALWTETFNDLVKKSLLDDFLENRRDQNGVRKFNAQDIRNFIAHIETNPGCLNARKIYDQQKSAIDRKIQDLKKQLALLNENTESNMQSLVSSCSLYPKNKTRPTPINPARQ